MQQNQRNRLDPEQSTNVPDLAVNEAQAAGEDAGRIGGEQSEEVGAVNVEKVADEAVGADESSNLVIQPPAGGVPELDGIDS